MCLVKTPNPPPAPALPPLAKEADAQQSNQAARIKRQQQAMTGYQGTVLSGKAGTLGAPSILGA